MKKTFFIACMSLLSALAFAQEKNYTFDKKLVYTNLVTSDPEMSEAMIINDYVSTKNKAHLTEVALKWSPSESLYSMVNQGKVVGIAGLSLEGKLKAKDFTYNPYSISQTLIYTNLLSSPIVFTKMNKKGKFGKLNCEYYEMSLKNASDDETVNDFVNSSCMCIDTDNPIKNLKSLIPQASLDGLIVSISSKSTDENTIYLKETSNVNLNYSFDFDKNYNDAKLALEEYEKENANTNTDYAAAVDSVYAASDYAYLIDPICNYYEYFQDLDSNLYTFAVNLASTICNFSTLDSDENGVPDFDRKKLIQLGEKQKRMFLKEAKKQKSLTKEEIKIFESHFETYSKAVKEFDPNNAVDTTTSADAAYAFDYNEVDAAAEAVAYVPYESDYKNVVINKINLAAELQLDNDIQAYMPSYCDELQAKIPAFKNEALKKHTHNLVGQMCDLYLYQNGGAVDYLGTINSMRKSLLEIENMREKLSKNDAKLLKDFLNSLD